MITNESTTGFHFAAVKYRCKQRQVREFHIRQDNAASLPRNSRWRPAPWPKCKWEWEWERGECKSYHMVACYHLAIAWWFSSKWLGKWFILDMFMSLFAFTQFGPGQWKSWRRDFHSSAVHGKGCMCKSMFGHIWNASCLTYCVKYVFVIIYILDLESCQIINKYHVSVSTPLYINIYL